MKKSSPAKTVQASAGSALAVDLGDQIGGGHVDGHPRRQRQGVADVLRGDEAGQQRAAKREQAESAAGGDGRGCASGRRPTGARRW
jgi:hypothetical protein